MLDTPVITLLGRLYAAALQWADALVGLSGNPLLLQWQRGARRRRSRLGPLGFLAAVAAGAGLIAWAMAQGSWDRGDIASFPLALAALALAPAALGWLAARLYSAAYICTACLSGEEQGRRRYRIDDMTALAPLTDAELLLPAVWLAVRLVLPPLLLCTAVLLVWLWAGLGDVLAAPPGSFGPGAFAPGSFELSAAAQADQPRDVQFLLAAPWVCARILLHGVLATAILALALLALGATRVSGLLPAAAALSLGAGQLALTWVAMYAPPQPYALPPEPAVELQLAVLSAAGFVAAAGVLLALALRQLWLQIGLAVLWPALLALSAWLPVLLDATSEPSPGVLRGALALTVFYPALVGGVAPELLDMTALVWMYEVEPAWQGTLLLLMQAALLPLAAAAAASALGRRRCAGDAARSSSVALPLPRPPRTGE